jgi:hypothetical protein
MRELREPDIAVEPPLLPKFPSNPPPQSSTLITLLIEDGRRLANDFVPGLLAFSHFFFSSSNKKICPTE